MLLPGIDTLPRIWMTAGANAELWGAASTYKAVAYDALPPIAGLDGSFAWLAQAPRVAEPLVLDGDSINERLQTLVAEARSGGLTVPDAFVRFMAAPELHARVPSCTACYLGLGARLLHVPGRTDARRLLRFMNDQQMCFAWYLLLERGGGHRIVVATPSWDNDDADEPMPTDAAICAANFDEFIHRVWIENTLWFAARQQGPLTDELRQYAAAARATQSTP